jgi:hypothetical protein
MVEVIENMANALQQTKRQLLSKTTTATYHEVLCAFYSPISHRDFWLFGIT